MSRTDAIGDVVLTLPLCAMLKRQLGAEVVALGRAYTVPVFRASPFVDEVLDWDTVAGEDQAAQRRFLRDVRADAVIHVFPRRAIARAALGARIPLRIGTSHRWYHWLTCNALERFSRRRSALHEAQLNVRLGRRLLGTAIPSLETLSALTRLVPQVELPASAADALDAARTIIVLHCKSKGSAREWPLDRWRELAESVDPSVVQIVLTGSAAEAALLRPFIATLPSHVLDLTGRLSLPELIALLGRVDGLVAASTGPLHLAAGVGIHALGLFAPTPPVHPGRWAPLGPRAEFLVADAPCARCARSRATGAVRCDCLLAISVEAVASRIRAWTRTRPAA